MEDLLHRRIDDEDAAQQHNQAVTTEFALNPATFAETEDRILEISDDLQQHEKQDDPENDREADTDRPDAALLIRWRSF